MGGWSVGRGCETGGQIMTSFSPRLSARDDDNKIDVQANIRREVFLETRHTAAPCLRTGAAGCHLSSGSATGRGQPTLVSLLVE